MNLAIKPGEMVVFYHRGNGFPALTDKYISLPNGIFRHFCQVGVFEFSKEHLIQRPESPVLVIENKRRPFLGVFS